MENNLEDIIIDTQNNSLIFTNSSNSPIVKASFNFEKVYDTEDLKKDIGILPVVSIYVLNMLDNEHSKGYYKELYKQLINTLGGLFHETYYVNTFEGDNLYCLKHSLIEGGGMVKLPYNTTLKIYRG